jgi:predicted nucleic acid-binding protein
MIILDTNVISEVTKPLANANVLAWINRQDVDDLFLTAINLAELLEGVAILPEGKRKDLLKASIQEAIAKLIRTPILPFDRAAALSFVSVKMLAKARRYTLPVADGQIAAIASMHGFAVATRDVEPFLAAGVPVVNPWERDR